MQSKRSLRKQYLEKRAALSLHQKHAATADMIEHLFEIPYAGADIAMGYQPMEEKNEVPADVFVQVLLDEGSIKRICFPSVDFDSDTMNAFLDDDDIVWENAAFGLVQPSKGNKVPPEKIDLVLVPLLAFDEKGFRLGYGKGFYDRYFANSPKAQLRVGVSYFEPIDRIQDTHEFDVPLTHCITPWNIYEF